MGKVIQMFEKPTPPTKGEEGAQAVSIAMGAIDGSVMLCIGEVELWLSIDETQDVVEGLSETLLDAVAQMDRLPRE